MTDTMLEAAMAVEDMLGRYDAAYLASQTRNRLGGSRRAMLRRWMHATYGAECVKCGTPTLEGRQHAHDPLYAHLGHIISAMDCSRAGGDRAGYVPGNIGIWCAECNYRNHENTVSPRDLARPDLIPLWWPTLSRRNPCA